MFFDSAGFNVPLAVLLAAVNLPVYWLLYRILFEDLDELAGAIKFWITPEIFSALRGENVDDIWAELKLGALAFGCVGMVVLEYVGLETYLASGGAV